MNGKTIVLGLVALVGIIALLYAVGHAEGATIIVPDDYATIHEAVENASAGDTVYIKAGTYTDWATINASLTLQGASPTNTSVKLNNTNPYLQSCTFYINGASDVSISGFNMNNCTGDAAIFGGLEGGFIDNITVVDCYFNDNGDGVALYNATNVVVRNCTAINSTGGWDGSHAVFSNCENILVEHNYFGEADYPVDFYDFYGIMGEYTSYNATVQYNTFENVASIAVGLYEINKTAILYNNFTNISGDAIGVYGDSAALLITGILVQGNIFEDCGNNVMLFPMQVSSAIYLNYANYVNITENYFYNCTGGVDVGNTSGITLDVYAGNTTIWYNNFVNNEKHVVFANAPALFNVTFDNGTTGNYWDNYTGVDANSDGIGDTPQPVGAGLVDNYPLMDPMTITYTAIEEEPGMFDDMTSILIQLIMAAMVMLLVAYMFKGFAGSMAKNMKK